MTACKSGTATPAFNLLFERMPLEAVDMDTAGALLQVLADALLVPLQDQYMPGVIAIAQRLLRMSSLCLHSLLSFSISRLYCLSIICVTFRSASDTPPAEALRLWTPLVAFAERVLVKPDTRLCH